MPTLQMSMTGKLDRRVRRLLQGAPLGTVAASRTRVSTTGIGNARVHRVDALSAANRKSASRKTLEQRPILMIDLYALTSPNVQKIYIMLEECGLPYKEHFVDVWKGEQYKPEFGKINPNHKIPVMVDTDGPGRKH